MHYRIVATRIDASLRDTIVSMDAVAGRCDAQRSLPWFRIVSHGSSGAPPGIAVRHPSSSPGQRQGSGQAPVTRVGSHGSRPHRRGAGGRGGTLYWDGLRMGEGLGWAGLRGVLS